jgi:REP element-mobilizing transposase RayT
MATKYRRKIINENIGKYLGEAIKEISEIHPEIDIKEYNLILSNYINSLLEN